MAHHTHTSWMGINVHYLHDEASTQLATMLTEEFPGSTMVLEPVDDVGWSGVRIFDEEGSRWVANLRWVRGAPRDLKQAAHQLGVAVRLRRDGEMRKPRITKARRARDGSAAAEHQSEQQGIKELHTELGVERRRHRVGGGKQG